MELHSTSTPVTEQTGSGSLSLSGPLDYLCDCFEKCAPDRSLEPAQLTVFHKMVRVLPADEAFSANHLDNSSMEDITALPLHQALAVCEYWIARNQLSKAKKLLNQLYPRHELDCRVQDALFRSIWYETHGLPEDVGSELKGRYCILPFERIDIYVGGDVTFCCGCWISSSIGNLFTSKEIDDVWNSEMARTIRKTIVDGSYRYCRKMHCYDISERGSGLKRELPVEYTRAVEEQGGHLSMMPTRYNLSYDRSCNLSCPGCRNEKIVAEQAEAEQIMRTTKDIVFPLMKNAKEVFLNGSGEFFVSPGFRWLLSQLATSENPTLYLELHTNGQLFTEREWASIKGLEKLWLVLSVSIDASEADTYAKLRRGGDFNRLLQNLEFIRSLRDNNCVKTLKFKCLVQDSNVNQLESFALMAKRYHADQIEFQALLDPFWGEYSSEEVSRKKIHDPGHPRHKDFLRNLQKALSQSSAKLEIFHQFQHLQAEMSSQSDTE
jgi:hypothetical protein